MANETNNYKLPKPEADDFYDISEYNKTMDLLDESLNELNEKKMDKSGDASEVITEYEQEVLKENIESGETLSVTHGKIKKWFSEMKDVAFSGKAKDLTPDAAHRFVTDTEKNDWNGKVSASGGDISGTVIGELENTTERYPVPDEGETTKVFMGKVEKFLKDIKPLDDNLTVYVATTGSDTTGDGSSSKPFKTITYALSLVPKDLNSHIVKIILDDGVYEEDVEINRYRNGTIQLSSSKSGRINVACIVKSLLIRDCTSTVIIESINMYESTNQNAITIFTSINVELKYIRSVMSNPENTSIIAGSSNVRVYNSELSNHGWAIYGLDGCKISSIDNIGTNNTKVVFSTRDGAIITTAGTTPSGTKSANIHSGGIITYPSGAIIGSLQQDITLYVSTSGDDITGDGTEDNPYETIQHAIDSIPRDLGGHWAKVLIEDGTYDERIIIQGFLGGRVELRSISSSDKLSNACNITDVRIMNNLSNLVVLNGLNFTTTTSSGIKCTTSGFVIIGFCRCATTSSFPGFSFDETRFEISYSAVANRGNALEVHGCTGNSMLWHESSINNTIGIYSEYGSIIHKIGNQPKGITTEYSQTAGMIINENGTQISGLITSGLSCTWATLQGGYIRHGNSNGAAMITVQIRATITTPLSGGTVYMIYGFPPTDVGAAITVHDNLMSYAQMNNDGTLHCKTISSVSTGYSIMMSCTYFTNS